MKHFKVIKGRLAVFHVKYKDKTDSGLLYRHKSEDFTLSGAQWVYVYRSGPNCRHDYKPGDKILIEDGCVLVDELPNTWDLCRELPEFKELADAETKLGLTIRCKIMFEGAVLAIDDKSTDISQEHV